MEKLKGIDDRDSTLKPPAMPRRTALPPKPKAQRPHLSAQELRVARSELLRPTIRLRSETAMRIYLILTKYSQHFGERHRESLANAIADTAQYVASQTPELIKNTVRHRTETAIDWAICAVPLDEKETIINEIVSAALREPTSPTPATSTTSER